METRTYVRPILVDWLCEECDEKMAHDGSTHVNADGNRFGHFCVNNHVVQLPKQYPHVDYEIIPLTIPREAIDPEGEAGA